ncbi:hypothetical protein NL676_034239 [Syzygium grande]|nr:hypothetical protein NL676_034239 [Syzygium grande]
MMLVVICRDLPGHTRNGDSWRFDVVGLLVEPQGSSGGGGNGKRCKLGVVFEEGGDDVGVEVSKLLKEVVVVVATVVAKEMDCWRALVKVSVSKSRPQ